MLAIVEGKTPPNILLIYTDDHAQWAVGAYGNKDVNTPNMDRLAQEGMRFTQGFTKAVCSPSRAMVLTGLYTHRLGIPDYIAYGNPVKEDVGLPAGTTIASMLKQRGYGTGLVGKWHLGYGPKYYPTKFGFDHAEGYRYIAPGADPAGVGRIPYWVNGREVTRFRSATNHTDVLAERAIDFIERNRKEPFFLFLSIYLPHLPWGAITDADKAHYAGKDLTLPNTDAIDREELLRLTRLYYANITCADRNIGRVLDRLDELKLADNTLVFFIGDNGFMVGQHDLLGKGTPVSFIATNVRNSGVPTCLMTLCWFLSLSAGRVRLRREARARRWFQPWTFCRPSLTSSGFRPDDGLGSMDEACCRS